MRRSLSIIVLLLTIVPLVFLSCDTGTDAESDQEPLEFQTAPSDELSSMIQETPSDFTWGYFQNNVQVNMIPGIDWNGEVVLSAFQVQNGEVVNETTTEPVETTADELAAGLSTEEMFSGSSWIQGSDWVPTSTWMPSSTWIQQTEPLVYAPSEIESIAQSQVDLSQNETMVVVYAHLAGESPEREQMTQPFGVIFQEEQQQEEVELTSQEVPADEAADARDYWTPERLQDAEPYQPGWETHEGEDPPPTQSTYDVPGPDVEIIQRDGSQPEFAEKGTTGDVIDSDTEVEEATQVDSDYTQYPYRTVGKVFFTKDGSGFTCSAAVIASENRSVVWTAGHCVSEQGEEDWHDRWIFIPAYEDGNEPMGRWSARVKTTIVAWHSGGNRNYDIGAVVVEERDSQSIASVTGSLGWMFNAQRNQDWRVIGYPASGSLFSGQKMWECIAPFDGADGVGSNSGPRTSAIVDCDMTGGASGGPWVVSFENCPQCYINAETSWGWWRIGHSNLSTQLASPYHGSAAHNLLQFAEDF